MKRVKSFYTYSENLADSINEFLTSNPDCELIDVKFQVSNGVKFGLLIYDKKDNTKI